MIYDEITVAQFCGLAIYGSETVRIWSCEQDCTLWEGAYRMAEACEYADEVVCSFNVEDGILCPNI